jgi:hypothetical protein
MTNKEIVIIPHDSGKIVRITGAFYKKPISCRRMGIRGRHIAMLGILEITKHSL